MSGDRNSATLTDLVDSYRQAARAEVSARIEHRQEKARRFLECQAEGLSMQVCWQRLNADDELAELEADAEYLRIERSIAWLLASGESREPGGGSGDG